MELPHWISVYAALQGLSPPRWLLLHTRTAQRDTQVFPEAQCARSAQRGAPPQIASIVLFVPKGFFHPRRRVFLALNVLQVLTLGALVPPLV